MKQKNKQDKHLRQKVEILKAQLSSSKSVYIPEPKPVVKTNSNESALKTDTKLIKKDLFKTMLLSLLAFSIIAAIKLSQ